MLETNQAIKQVCNFFKITKPETRTPQENMTVRKDSKMLTIYGSFSELTKEYVPTFVETHRKYSGTYISKTRKNDIQVYHVIALNPHCIVRFRICTAMEGSGYDAYCVYHAYFFENVLDADNQYFREVEAINAICDITE